MAYVFLLVPVGQVTTCPSGVFNSLPKMALMVLKSIIRNTNRKNFWLVRPCFSEGRRKTQLFDKNLGSQVLFSGLHPIILKMGYL